MPDKLFVYGSLMRGRSNYRLLLGNRFLGVATVHGICIYEVTPEFPGAVICAGKKVKGELFEIDDASWDEIDRLEDNNKLYRRELFTAVKEESGEEAEAWVYLWLHGVDQEKEIPIERQPWQYHRVLIE